MAQSTQNARQEAPAEVLPPAAQDDHRLREPLEDVPMCRYAHPIPQCRRDADRGCRQEEAQSRDMAAILAALEQQNSLLTELLGAVTGLTAACLCRNRQE